MWMYKGKVWEPVNGEMRKYEGFVYCITNMTNGMKYIGKKAFWSRTKLPPLKGKTRKRHVIKESNWRDYYGSSDEVKMLVEELGYDKFKREILHFCETKGEMSYMELKEQVEREVLFDDSYYNGIVQVRINRNHVKSMKT